MVSSIVSELPGNLALSGTEKKVSLCSVSCPFVFGSTRCHNVTGARKAFFGCVFTSEHASFFLRGSTKVLTPSKTSGAKWDIVLEEYCPRQPREAGGLLLPIIIKVQLMTGPPTYYAPMGTSNGTLSVGMRKVLCCSLAMPCLCRPCGL